jgi:hypothetical protein
MMNEPFFLSDRDGFRPTPVCRGPWDPTSLHGRVVAGLLAHEIERRHGDPALLPARLTVDLYRLPGFAPVTVTTSIVRDGHRIKVVDAEFISDGVSVGRATCQLLRRGESPPGRVWMPPVWDAPKPHEIPAPEDGMGGMGGMWAVRPIDGAFGAVGRKRLWMSEVRELVGGIPLTPFTRVALAADFASPFANSGDAGLGYINTDITLYLSRLPRTAWLGFDVVNHHADDGIAHGQCRLYDEDGPIGTSSVAALAASRRTTPPPGKS